MGGGTKLFQFDPKITKIFLGCGQETLRSLNKSLDQDFKRT